MSHSERTIVVGAGAAGTVIAARMTEREDREVLLLEAGPDYGPERLPTDLLDGTRNSLRAHDWGYTHKPNARQMTLPLPRGRVVGGSSAVNTCIALRGVPSDYDEWAALGLDDWSWEQCLPAFKRLERDLDVRNEWHGDDGPVPLRRHTPAELVPWQAAFLEACERVGHPRCDDHNDPRARGYGPHAMNKLRGERMSAARCYLTASTRARPNLALRAETTAVRVRFAGRRVTGLEVETRGVREVLAAGRVVLCAGAIATPGLLLRSGVGADADLARLGVERVAHVPGVAARLLDHPGCALFFAPRARAHVDPAQPLIQAALRLRSPRGEHENDVQYQAGSVVHLPGLSVRAMTLMMQVGKPRGHGHLRYESASPHARPVISSRLLDHADDRALAVASLQHLLELAEQPPLRALGRLVWPAPGVVRRRAWLDELVRLVSDSGYHPCGTAPMGPEGAPWAVTDGRGRVRGTEGLLVADASLMPTVPTANTHLPTLMLGERFGAWLRDGAL